MKIIEVKNLSKDFYFYKKEPGISGAIKALFKRNKQTKNAVKNISFSIGKGEIVGFVGPNGAGKTTTLKMLSGILTPTSGFIRVSGFEPIKREDSFLREIAIVLGQKSQLQGTLPALESLNLIKYIYGIPETLFEKRLDYFIKLLELKDLLKVEVRKLSLGERMKFELIAALIYDPKILFLDEPTIGLDIVSQKKIREFLLEYNKEKKVTIILTSHYLEDIKKVCQRVIVINYGEVILDDSILNIEKRYSQDKNVKIIFGEKVIKSKLEKIGNIISFTGYEAELSLSPNQLKESIGELVSKFPITDLNIADVTLEEIIGDVFRSSKN